MRIFNWFGLFGLANLYIGYFFKFELLLYIGLAVVLFFISAQVWWNEITNEEVEQQNRISEKQKLLEKYLKKDSDKLKYLKARYRK